MKYKVTFVLETNKLPSKWFQPILDEVLCARESISDCSFKLIKEETDGGSER